MERLTLLLTAALLVMAEFVMSCGKGKLVFVTQDAPGFSVSLAPPPGAASGTSAHFQITGGGIPITPMVTGTSPHFNVTGGARAF